MKLSYNHKTFEAVFSAATVGIIVVDSSGKILQANPFATQLFGYDQHELDSKQVEVLIPAKIRSTHLTHRKDYLSDPTPRLMGEGRDLYGVRKDGSKFSVEISLSHTEIDNIGVVITFVSDITDRVQNVEALKEQESRLASIINTAADGIITISKQGVVESINPSAALLFGYDSEEVIGQKINMLMTDPERTDHDQYLDNYHSSGERKIIGIGREVNGRKKDGVIFPFHLSVSKVKTKNNIIYTGIIHDLTNRKLAEEKLRRYTKALERSNRELEDFAYVSSHDLQEPLRKIRAFGDRLKSRIADKLEEKEADYLNRMLNGAERMQGLINDLLAFSRIDTSGQGFELVNLNDIVKRVISDLEILIKESNAQIQFEALPTIEADATQMWQLFQNLLNNAIKFRKAEVAPSIKITTRQIPGNLGLKATPGDVQYEISVTDNGIGFDKQYEDKIFQIFQRLEGRKYEGSGIGLAICQRITNRHGGDIVAHSELGEGSTFIISLASKQMQK